MGTSYVAINCGQWCSAKFAVLVSKWVFEWMSTGHNPLSPKPGVTPPDIQAELEELEQLIIGIRSQARILHTGAHQPVDERLLKSLHSLSHQQLALITAAIGQVQVLKQVAEMAQLVNSSELESVSGVANARRNADWLAFNGKRSTSSSELKTAVRFTVDLPESMHRKLSILSAKTGRTKADIVRMLLDEKLKDLED